MIFLSNKVEKVGKKISRRLGKELKMKGPPAYQVEQQGGQGAYKTKDMVKDVGAMIFGSSRTTTPLYRFLFEIQDPREWHLQVEVIQGAGRTTVLGGLLFTASVDISLASPVSVADTGKTFKKPSFVGDPDVCIKLNDHKKIRKTLKTFLRDRYEAGSQRVTTGTQLFLTPTSGKPILSVYTAPRSSWGKSSSHFDSPIFLELVNKIEATL